MKLLHCIFLFSVWLLSDTFAREIRESVTLINDEKQTYLRERLIESDFIDIPDTLSGYEIYGILVEKEIIYNTESGRISLLGVPYYSATHMSLELSANATESGNNNTLQLIESIGISVEEEFEGARYYYVINPKPFTIDIDDLYTQLTRILGTESLVLRYLNIGTLGFGPNFLKWYEYPYASPFWQVPLIEGQNTRATWFGEVEDTFFPRVRHAQHGWLMMDYWKENGDVSLFYEDPRLGECITSQTLYPWIYQEEPGDWLWYVEGTDNPRWFYSLSLNDWVSFFDPVKGELPE